LIKSINGGSRCWLEIIHMILSACTKSALKTHIMYKCNLNSSQIRKYLEFLLNKNLIKKHYSEKEHNRPLYTITTLGERYIDVYNEIIKILENDFTK